MSLQNIYIYVDDSLACVAGNINARTGSTPDTCMGYFSNLLDTSLQPNEHLRESEMGSTTSAEQRTQGSQPTLQPAICFIYAVGMAGAPCQHL